jgi:hypothetical protein
MLLPVMSPVHLPGIVAGSCVLHAACMFVHWLLLLPPGRLSMSSCSGAVTAVGATKLGNTMAARGCAVYGTASGWTD